MGRIQTKGKKMIEPTPGDYSVTYCSAGDCSDYDGKRCSRLGYPPGGICEPAVMALLEIKVKYDRARKTRLVFSQPPGPHSSFVEVEDEDGKSFNAGSWTQEDDLWVFTLDNL